MANGDFDAGSVLIRIRAESQDAQRQLKRTQRAIQEVARGAGASATEVTKAGTAIGETLSAADQQSIRATARVQQFATGLLALQGVISTLGSNAGESFNQFRKGVDSASVGLQTFVATVAVTGASTNRAVRRTGLLAGAIGGLSLAVIKFLAPTQEEIKSLDDLSATMERTGDLTKTLEIAQRGIAETADTFLLPATERATLALQAQQKAVAAVIAQAASVPEQIRVLERRLGDVSGVQRRNIEEQIRELRRFAKFATGQLLEFREQLQRSRAEVTAANVRDRVRELGDEFERLQKVGQISIAQGLITPLERAQTEFEAARQGLEEFIELQVEAGKVGDELFRTIENRLRAGASAAEFNQILTQLEGAVAGTAASVIIERFRKAQDELRRSQAPQEFAESFADPLAQTIGDAVVDGILAGEDAFTILANTAEQLFADFLRNTVNTLQQNLSSALTEILGAGGGALGGLLSAGLAVGGFLATRRGGAQQTFAGGPGVVTSSQAVRGIVAGPSSVAVSAVGENLQRALRGVEERLDDLIQISEQIRINTAAGAGASRFAGSTATA